MQRRTQPCWEYGSPVLLSQRGIVFAELYPKKSENTRSRWNESTWHLAPPKWILPNWRRNALIYLAVWSCETPKLLVEAKLLHAQSSCRLTESSIAFMRGHQFLEVRRRPPTDCSLINWGSRCTSNYFANGDPFRKEILKLAGECWRLNTSRRKAGVMSSRSKAKNALLIIVPFRLMRPHAAVQ